MDATCAPAEMRWSQRLLNRFVQRGNSHYKQLIHSFLGDLYREPCRRCPDRVFAEGGVQEAVLEAKKAGKARYKRFAGHKDPHVHLCMPQKAAEHGLHFDTVQVPLNVMDAHFAASRI